MFTQPSGSVRESVPYTPSRFTGNNEKKKEHKLAQTTMVDSDNDQFFFESHGAEFWSVA